MTTAELRLECLKLAEARQGARDPRQLLDIAAELFAWCTDPNAVVQAAAAMKTFTAPKEGPPSQEKEELT